MTAGRLDVLVVVGQAILRRGVQATLLGVGEVTPVADVASAVDALGSRDVDALVLDTELDQALELLDGLGELTDARVVLLTSAACPGVHALDARVLDREQLCPETLVTAVSGLAFEAPAPARRTPAEPAPAAVALETREQAVLQLAAEGLTTLQIAAQLHYGQRTIKADLSRATSKLRARSRLHAIAIAARMGIIDADGRSVAAGSWPGPQGV